MTNFQIICWIILGVTFVVGNGYTLWITIQTNRWEKKRYEERWERRHRQEYQEETEFLDIEDLIED